MELARKDYAKTHFSTPAHIAKRQNKSVGSIREVWWAADLAQRAVLFAKGRRRDVQHPHRLQHVTEKVISKGRQERPRLYDDDRHCAGAGMLLPGVGALRQHYQCWDHTNNKSSRSSIDLDRHAGNNGHNHEKTNLDTYPDLDRIPDLDAMANDHSRSHGRVCLHLFF